MADRIPLIVNPSAEQIQELPNADDLVLSGQLKMTGTTSGASDINLSGGTDAKSVIGITSTKSNLSQLSIDCRKNADDADATVVEFKIGAGDKIELDCKGSITAVQPNCLVSDPPTYSVSSSTNTDPIQFQQVNTNVGGFTLTNSNSTIAVPIAGTYLISASISGMRTTNNVPTDMAIFQLYKNSSIFPHDAMYPRGMIGTQNNEEWNFTFTIPLALAASDTINVALNNLNTSGGEADIQAGYLSVVKLH